MNVTLDSFVFLAPVLLLAVVGLLAFVGCDVVFGLERPPELPFAFVGTPVDHVDLGPVSSVVAPFAADVTAGNLVIVWIWFHTSSNQVVASVADSAGNTYVPADTLKAGDGAFASARQQVWYAKDVVSGGGTPLSLTVTFSGTVEPSIGVGAFEYVNADKTEPLVIASAASGLSHEPQNPAVTTSGAKMLFGAVLFSGDGEHDPVAIRRLIQRGNIAEEYLTLPLPQQIKGIATNPQTQSWVAQLVAFK